MGIVEEAMLCEKVIHEQKEEIIGLREEIKELKQEIERLNIIIDSLKSKQQTRRKSNPAKKQDVELQTVYYCQNEDLHKMNSLELLLNTHMYLSNDEHRAMTEELKSIYIRLGIPEDNWHNSVKPFRGY